MKTYEFDTWAAYKEFMAEKRKTLKADDEIIVRQPLFKGAEPTTLFKVVIPYWEEHDTAVVAEYADENGNLWVNASTDTQAWDGIFGRKPAIFEENKK